MSGWLKGFGALRLMLMSIAAVLVLLGPFSGGPVRFEGFAFFVTLVAPAFYVIVLFVLPLDMTMSRIFMADAPAADRARFRRILITEAVLFVLMVLSWLPFVLALLRLR